MIARPAVRSGWLVLCLAACQAGAAVDPADRDLLQVRPGEVHVLLFLNPECPIANAYAPTLQSLAAGWQDQPVRLFLVHVDPAVDAARAATHAADYHLPGSVQLDPQHRVVRRVGITRTPEAAVLTSQGLIYRGRIDDQWQALGTRRPAATQNDLAQAVAAALNGQRPAEPWPPAVGCLLPEPAAP